MARQVLLRHPETNEVLKGFYGFCWTGLFFGGLPALARGNLRTGLALLVLAAMPFVVPYSFARALAGFLYIFVTIVFACEYNRFYTLALLDRGFQFFDRAENVAAAKRALGYGASNVLNVFGRRLARHRKPAPPSDTSEAA